MTREELRERIKNEVVLHEGELADWQWRQKGLVDEATELGILPSDFIRLVNEVSLQVNRDYSKISELKSRIETLARQRARQLTPADIDQIAVEAERVQLSRSFVEDQWLPAILETIPETQPGAEPKPEAPGMDPARTGETRQPQPGIAEPDPELKTDSVRRKIKSILDDYEKHIPAQSLRFLFKAVDYDETALAEEIRQYLSENYYASVNPPKGNTLKEKLISTDWRHLSWWEKGPAAAPAHAAINRPTEESTTGSSLGSPVAARSAPVPTPAPATPETSAPSKSGLSDVALIALSILTALVLIWVVMRLARGDEEEPAKNPPTRKERTEGSDAKRGKQNGVATLESQKGSTSSGGRNGNKKKVGLRFDEVDDRIGEFGLRAARKGTKWGYINSQNRWIIKPIYDRAAPFNEKKASVELNGSPFFIDRKGNQIRSKNQKLTNEF